MSTQIEKLINDSKMTNRVMIDAKMALHILNNAQYERQRKLKRNNIQKYLTLMHNGQFNNYHALYIVKHVHSNKYFLLNGQHRLAAIIKYQQQSFGFLINYVEVSNMNEINKIYSSMDVNTGRNLEDSLISHGMVTNYHAYILKGITKATKIINYKFNYRRSSSGWNIGKKTDFDHVNFFGHEKQNIYNFVDFVLEHTKIGSIKKRILTGQLIALGSKSLQARQGTDFWLKVCHDNELKVDDPCKVFLDYIKMNKSGSSYLEMYRQHNAFARCWNAKLKYHKIKFVKIPKNDSIVEIKGVVL